MKIPAEIMNNQTYTQHALYFDAINQPLVTEGLQGPTFQFQRLNYDKFKNVPGVTPFDDGSFEITYFAPYAKEVKVRGTGGSMPGTYELKPDPEMPGYFKTVIDDVCPGFHFIEFIVDGVCCINNTMPIGYGCSYAMNFIDLPDPDFRWGLLTDVPHGTIHMEIYKSEITGRYRNCWVYTPPRYNIDTEKRYPVFYVQHGGGENETDWIWQGKINYIMDNLLAEGECEEMIIVMNCGYNFTEQEDGDFKLGELGDIICKECVPMIDERYRTIPDKTYRAMAGLSFGSYHAKTTVLNNLDVFSSVGIWSGVGPMMNRPMPTNVPNSNAKRTVLPAHDFSRILTDKEYFNEHLKLMFVGYGDQETNLVEANEVPGNKMIEEGYHFSNNKYPGYHEWSVWRRCARDMAKLLFKW